MTSSSGPAQASIRHVSSTSDGRDWQFPAALALLYVLLVAYGSLYPFVGWNFAQWPQALRGLTHWPLWLPRSDMITNLLVYIPVGAMLAAIVKPTHPLWRRALIALLLALGLSLSMEVLQAALPQRVASLRDLCWNTLGAGLGVACSIACADQQPLRRGIDRLRRDWLNADANAVIGALILLLWLLTQWLPLSLDFDPQRILNEWRLLGMRLEGARYLSRPRIAVESLQLLAIGMIWLAVCRVDRRPLVPFLGLLLLSLLVQLLLIDRQVPAERLLALVAVVPLLIGMLNMRRWWPWLAILSLLAAILIDGTYSGFPSSHYQKPFNWIPFIGNFGRISNLSGLTETLWLYSALAFWIIRFRSNARPPVLSVAQTCAGLVVVLIIAGGVEWAQTFYRDRWADITDLIVASSGWLLAIWLHRSIHTTSDAVQRVRTTDTG